MAELRGFGCPWWCSHGAGISNLGSPLQRGCTCTRSLSWDLFRDPDTWCQATASFQDIFNPVFFFLFFSATEASSSPWTFLASSDKPQLFFLFFMTPAHLQNQKHLGSSYMLLSLDASTKYSLGHPEPQLL